MAKAKALTKPERTAIDEMVAEYRSRRVNLETFQGQLQALLMNPGNALAPHVHSFKWRLKQPSHLREKLRRKILLAKKTGQPFDINRDNMFDRINDLVGMRILHLYTRQISAIDKAIKALLDEGGLHIVEGPFARTWDTETKSFFDEVGIETRESGPSMYTSVHYIVDSNSKTRYTAELQVRTLAEELWGEVTHVIDYPSPCTNSACREQIRVLARVASSCTRVVDSIFHTYDNFTASRKRKGRARRRSQTPKPKSKKPTRKK